MKMVVTACKMLLNTLVYHLKQELFSTYETQALQKQDKRNISTTVFASVFQLTNVLTLKVHRSEYGIDYL